MTLKWYGDDAERKVFEAAGDGLFEAAEFLLEEANRTVPLEEGPLQNSGVASVDRTALMAAVSYNTPYAVRQHEELDYRHDEGRRAKWLELSLNEERERLQEHIAKRMREAL